MAVLSIPDELHQRLRQQARITVEELQRWFAERTRGIDTSTMIDDLIAERRREAALEDAESGA